MDLTVDRAAPDAALVLANLWQLYAHDLSDVVDLDVGDDGRFPPRGFEEYWRDDGRHAFLLRVDGRLAGFALVHRRSRLTGDPGTWDMAEFFVLRRHRRQGVGRLAATWLFDTFAGPWEVRQLFRNTAASRFWRAVIAAYTGGRFSEVVVDDDRWRGPVQAFDSRR
jgi:predicted acetyltransferase